MSHAQKEDGHVPMQAELSALWPQAKECREFPASTVSRERQGRWLQGEGDPAHTLISAFRPPGLRGDQFLLFCYHLHRELL